MPQADPRPPAESPAESQIFVGRQPILDGHQSLYAYELLFRDSALAGAARVLDDTQATSRLLINTFNNLGLDRVLAGRVAFINVSAGLLASEVPELLPPERVVFEILEHVEPAAELIARVQRLRAAGYRFALDDFTYRPELEPLIGLAEFIKLDLRALGARGIAEHCQRLRGRGPKLLAEKVETRPEHEQCRALGIDYFQGYYFARPETLAMKRMDPQAARVMQLFNLVIGQAEAGLVELQFKQDVALSYNLLKYINSAGFGLAKKVDSVRHALVVLGHTKLARWLSLMMLSGIGATLAPQALFRVALARARMAELLGRERLPAAEHDYLFMTGMFSLLDALLEMPLPDILASLTLPAAVTDALLARRGPYAPFLTLTEACERLDAAAVATFARALRLDVAAITRLQMEALAWAEDVSRAGG